MKRLKAILAVLVVIGVIAVAQAAGGEMTVVPTGTRTVRQLTEAEVARLELSQASKGAVSALPDSRSSYTVYSYTDGFEFRLDGEHVATANIECIVYHYDDGKVHLYSRSITARRILNFDVARTYGQIVNTDGSLSYTTGDRVHIYAIMGTWNYAIDFRVTPTDASFSCYEV